MAGTLARPETILVVDDSSLVVNVVVSILKRAHFHVLEAGSGAAAVEVGARHPGVIDLLLSAIMMPLMSGPDLAEVLKGTRPDIRIMFMSAFVGGDLLVLNYGWAFIEKPFVAGRLVQMIHSVLDSPDKSQGNRSYTRPVDRSTKSEDE